MAITVHKLLQAVPDDIPVVSRERSICPVFIGIDRCPCGYVFLDNWVKRSSVCIGYDLRPNFARSAHHPEYGRFIDATRPSDDLTLFLGVHGSSFLADVRFVKLDGAEKQAGVFLSGLPKPVVHEPGCFLANAYVLGQLVRGNSLAAVEQEVDGDKPFPERKLAVAEDCAVLDGEVLLALGAAIPLAVRELVDFIVAAMHAELAITKTNGGKMIATRFLVTEIIRELGKRLKFKHIFHSTTIKPLNGE